MNIHVKLTGEAAIAVEDLIKRGYAANKTEAIRHAVLECKHITKEQKDEEELRVFTAGANRDIWENKEEDKIWIKYLKGDKK